MSELSVDIKNTDVFKNLADMVKMLANDKRVPVEVREEIVFKCNELFNGEKGSWHH